MASREEDDPRLTKDQPDSDDEDVEDVPDVPPRDPWVLEQLAQGAVLLLLTAAISPVSQFTLAPVFGSIPSAVNHSIAIIITFLSGNLLHFISTTATESTQLWIAANIREWLTVWPFWIPVIQSALLHIPSSSSYLGPVAGPIVQGIFSCHLVLLPSAYALADLYHNLRIGRPGGFLKSGIVLSSLLVMPFIMLESNTSRWLTKLLTKYKSLTPVHLQVALGVSYFLVFISWTPIFSLTIPGLLHTIFFNQHLSQAMVNDHLEPFNWTLVDRQWSNTGYISVLESSNEQYRVLRADHSLLGGEFYLTPERIVEEWKVNEPIYAVFEMLEAIRLIETSPKIPDASAKALVIGLGIGTAPKALISHGIDTTIIELDPVVHDFATRYFSLPTDHTAIFADAVAEINATAHRPTAQRQQYDYILHDVFTGGAEPLALFTAPFLTNLRSLLTPKGLIALNYAGDLSSPLTTRILTTISQTFQNCKIYRDAPRAVNQIDPEHDFLNLVIFCRNDPRPITFRKPVERDYLGSKSRAFYMLPKEELEIQFPPGKGEILGDEGLEDFESEQAESARRHWKIMRGVVPDAVWELW